MLDIIADEPATIALQSPLHDCDAFKGMTRCDWHPDLKQVSACTAGPTFANDLTKFDSVELDCYSTPLDALEKSSDLRRGLFGLLPVREMARVSKWSEIEVGESLM